MAFSLDFDIYNWLLVEILKVNPTGDPVNDAVYLVLLPMVVLYMFVTDVTARSRFNSNTIKFPIMFVMGFFIVREGYYPIFAGFSLPLLIFLMVWYSIEFIRGEKADTAVTYNYQRPSGGEGIIGGVLGNLMHPFSKLGNDMGKYMGDASIATWSKDQIEEHVGRLISHWEEQEIIVQANRQAHGGGWTAAGNAALAEQDMIEEELARFIRAANRKVNIWGMIKDERMKREVGSKLSGTGFKAPAA